MLKVRVVRSSLFTSWEMVAAGLKELVNLRWHTFNTQISCILLSLTLFACDSQQNKTDLSPSSDHIDSLAVVIKSTPYRALHQISTPVIEDIDWNSENWKQLSQEELLLLLSSLIAEQQHEKTTAVINVLLNQPLKSIIEAQALRLLAFQHYQLGDYNANLHTLRKIERIDSAQRDTTAWLTNILNQASSKHALGLYSSSIDACLKAIDLSEAFKSDSLKTVASNHLANVYIMIDSLDAAEKVLLSQKNNSNTKEQNFLIDLNLAVIEDHRGNQDKSIALYKELLLIARDNGDSTDVQNLLYNLAYAYYEIGDCDKAFLYFDKYYFLLNELDEAAFKVKLLDAQTKYESLKKEQKIQALEAKRQQQEKQMLYLGLISVLILVVAGLSVFTLRNRSINQRLKFDATMKRLEHEKEITSFNATLSGIEQERKRIAMNLHDGVGVLTSTAILMISGFRKKVEDDKQRGKLEDIIAMLKQMATDIRSISHDLMPAELEKLGLKIALEELLMKSSNAGSLSFSSFIDEEINQLNDDAKVMLYRITQELINNTIKHSSAKNVAFSLKKVGDKIHLGYSDDGVGYDMVKLANEGKGLQSIRSRVQFLKGEIAMNSSLMKGVYVQISIPYEEV